MKRFGLALAAGLLASCSALPASAAYGPRNASVVALHGSIVGAYPTHATMEIYVRLQGRNETQIDDFITALNTPGSPYFRRYLTPQQYANYFGADPATYASAIASLRKAGFVIESLPANHTDIIASAPEQTVSAYFSTPIDVRQEGSRVFFANRFEPLFPRELRAEAVSGLDDYVQYHPHIVRRPNVLVNGSFSWGPSDIATAYDLNPLYADKLDGSGVTIANATCGAALPSDLAIFQKKFGIGGSLLTKGVGGGVTTRCGPYDNSESTLDVDSALGVARGATFQQVVAHGPSNADFDKAYSYIVNTLGSTVHVATTSWGGCEASVRGTPSLTVDEKLFAQAATEGQIWFAAAGDNGTDDCDGYPKYSKVSVDYPGTSKYVVDVGGTNVRAAISASGNVTRRINETVWQFSNSSGASGGGKSVLFAKPSYQRKLTPKDAVRDVPDVALLADPSNDGMWVAKNGVLQGGWGGTSEAAPQWAGLLAIVVQRNGNKAVQDPHARLYALAATAKYDELFYDITKGNNGVPPGDDPYGTYPGYNAGRGYDLCTGLGSFNGAKLVKAY